MRSSLVILAIIAMALVGMAGATPASNNATIFSNPVVFAGTTTVSGTLTAAVLSAASTVSGHLASSLTVDAASAITAAAGADPFDYSLSTSYFYTGTGTHKLNGNVLIGPAATKTLTVSGATTVNSLVSNGTISGTDTSFSTLRDAGIAYISGATKVNALATMNSATINTTLTQNGPIVTGATTSATNDTLTSASKSLYFIGAAAGQRIILPAVSGNTGLTYTFVITTAATGSHLNIIDGSGSENINGATTIACATKYAAIRLVCTGTEWVATSIGQVGTWASYAGS